MEAIRSLSTLQWAQEPKFHPLPANITREFVKTPGGPIELLMSDSAVKDSDTRKPPICFAHGGEGHACVWLEWMEYLSTCYNGRTYAYSLRCHGASYVVPYWKMVWQTSLDDLASDLVASLEEVRLREGQDPILVAHSSGGGLSQYILSKGQAKARAIALIGSVPHWGNVSVYFNWFRRIDPWFCVRNILHLYHPNSPLSSPRLVHNAFFGPRYPISRVPEFMKWMSNYEAMWWPFGMAGRGWGIEHRTWLDTKDIVSNIVDWSNFSDKVMVMIGTEDKMMRGTEGRMVEEYREGIEKMRQDGTIEIDPSPNQTPDNVQVDDIISEARHGGVRLVKVQDAGHHTQNDVQWREAAEALRSFADQV